MKRFQRLISVLLWRRKPTLKSTVTARSELMPSMTSRWKALQRINQSENIQAHAPRSRAAIQPACTQREAVREAVARVTPRIARITRIASKPSRARIATVIEKTIHGDNDPAASV